LTDVTKAKKRLRIKRKRFLKAANEPFPKNKLHFFIGYLYRAS